MLQPANASVTRPSLDASVRVTPKRPGLFCAISYRNKEKCRNRFNCTYVHQLDAVCSVFTAISNKKDVPVCVMLATVVQSVQVSSSVYISRFHSATVFIASC